MDDVGVQVFLVLAGLMILGTVVGTLWFCLGHFLPANIWSAGGLGAAGIGVVLAVTGWWLAVLMIVVLVAVVALVAGALVG